MEGVILKEVTEMERLDNHEQRISELETNYSRLESKFNDLEKGQLAIQNTVLLEFSSTKTMLTDQNNMNQKLLDHMYGIKTTGMTTRATVIASLCGGGLLATIVTLVVANWGKFFN